MEKLAFQHKWSALIGLSLLAFTGFLDYTIVNTALPFIQKALSISTLDLQWVSNIFAIITSMLMIAIGRFADLFGKKRLFFGGIAVFGVAALGAGLSRSIEMLIFFRALQSVGSAATFTIGAALLPHAFPKEEQSRATSIYSGITGLGLVIGPVAGGLLVGLLDWRWVFWVNIPFIVVGWILCSFSLGKDPVQEKGSIDWWGFFFLIVGVGALNYGIVEGAKGNFTTPWPILIGMIGVVALAILIWLELHKEDPLLDLNIFGNPLILLATLSCLLAGVLSYVFLFFDPLYLHIVRKLSAFSIGFLIAAIPCAQVVISLAFSTLLKKFGVSKLLLGSLVAGLLATIGHLGISIDSSFFYLILIFFLVGITWGVSNAGAITVVNESVPLSRNAATLGTIFTLWSIAGSLFLALSSALFHLREKDDFLHALGAQIPVGEANRFLEVLNDPGNVQAQLMTITQGKAEEVLGFFFNAFVDAFHAVMELNGAVALLLLLLGIWKGWSRAKSSPYPTQAP